MKKHSKLIISINLLTIIIPLIYYIFLHKKYIIVANYFNKLSLIFIIMTNINLIYIFCYIFLEIRKKARLKNIKLLLTTKHLSSSIIRIIKKHLRIILRKKDICLLPNEYNVIDVSRFEKEKEYFFKKVFLMELKSDISYLNFKNIFEKEYILNTQKDKNLQKNKFLLLPKFQSIFNCKLINYKNLSKLKEHLDLNKFIISTTRLNIKKPIKISYIKYNSFNDFITEYFYKIFNIIITNCNSCEIKNSCNLKTGIDLEINVSTRLKNLGYTTTLTKTSGDQGVDVLAEKNNKLIAIQCKLYSKPVGNKAVQEIIAGKLFYNANYGVVVTNNDYTKSAKELANKCGIFLFNINYLESSFEDMFN